MDVVWRAQKGAQRAFMTCPVFEVLIEGNRGGGKTDVLIMDFAQHIGKFGSDWQGYLFRQTYKQLDDVVKKTKKWFPQIWPAACFRESDMTWTWPGGERLLLRYMERPDDYWNYHGSEFPWIAFEELTTWHSDECYKIMMSCCRSSRKDMPRAYRATTNPYGPGHNWVKHRFQLPIPPGRVAGPLIIIEDELDDTDEEDLYRVAIHSDIAENKILLDADPSYMKKVLAAAPNKAAKKAWKTGSWDIVAGGMIDDLWDPAIHVVPDFTFDVIPEDWRINRSYDHGQSAPFSVGWWAESNGETFELDGRTYGAVPGDLFRIQEWYGWNGEPNQGLRMFATDIGTGIIEREEEWGISDRVEPGPADTSIFDDYSPGKSVAGDMEEAGVEWTKADKGPGSRKQGWERVRKLLGGAIPQGEGEEKIRERPGLFICVRCEQFRRTFPVLPRSKKDLDDADTNAEDHLPDEVRYRVREKVEFTECEDW